ncbi:O-antigen ligase family protein [Massilia horti]|uniref:O-antigen ligase domain-containing protein n=1 Tax=Massilia horti TaxID=2562153 RepID=A0A4Y9TB29_9BURK|nr:O-antigen ligase family protein [Massilia horti]TFW36000.1 O-antigen ligase domain-containing protein [Massilia horti]
MDDLISYIYLSLPFLFVAFVAVLAVAGMGIGLVWTRALVYPYLAIFFWMNSTSYGNLSLWATPGVYSRGSGMLFFPLVLYYVLGAWCCARVAAGFRHQPAAPCNLRPWFLAWLLLLSGHVAVALFLGVKLADALAPSGFSNIVWMAPLVSLLLLAFHTRAHAVELARFILLAGLARALFGLVRWAAFGGDPNNVYANMNAIRIKLTFFDINDSLLCVAAFAIAAVNLFQAARIERARLWVALEWMTLFSTALCIVLSYRRSAWIGFVLAALVIMMRFPLRRRIQLASVGLPLVGAGLLYVALKRLGQTKGAGSGFSSLFYDIQSQRFGAESERVLELKLALADFLSHLVTGIGSWGRYFGYQHISWQANPDGGLFLHSGVLHLALKTGLIGLALLAGTIFAFTRVAWRALATLPPEQLALATAGVAGIAFMLPDFLIGTPIPQVRTTQMLAVCLALPYVALAAGAASAPAVATTRINLVPA